MHDNDNARLESTCLDFFTTQVAVFFSALFSHRQSTKTLASFSNCYLKVSKTTTKMRTVLLSENSIVIIFIAKVTIRE